MEAAKDRYEVAVVGAGQAGLAIGHLLAGQGRRFTILEAADSVGSVWRTRWDSLVLFTPRRYDALPGLAFPGDPEGYPTRDEVAGYLERYAEHFELPVELSTPVRSLSRDGGGFVLDAGGRTIRAGRVVVATGPFQTPVAPALAAGLDESVFQTHSAGYRRPDEVPGRRVLVVGGGNTGLQIAKELAAAGRDVHLAVGSRQTPLPQRLLGRDLFWWLTRLGLLSKTADSRFGRHARSHDTLIGSSPRETARRGVTLRPRAVAVDGRTVRFADGGELEPDAVIWATGYRPDHSWIDLPILGEDGRLSHRRGVSTVPGLYFLGLSWQHTRGSALIGFVADDAAFVAREIAAGAAAVPVPVQFPTDPAGLPEATAPELVELGDGGRFELRVAPVAKAIGGETVRMLAYNGSVPGPALRVRQGSDLTVDLVNEGDLEATVHWHGLRLENRFDGTPETQAPVPVGDGFSYRISFPDPGVYWYHPHIREDYGQELGQYGNILVVPAEPDYWPPAHREQLLTLDDVLIEDGRIAPFSREETTFAAMGRYGNVLLVGGEVEPSFPVLRGEVVRLYLTNTANTRVFDVALPGARLKLVGGDSGRVEHEELVESVVIAPSERVVVDVLFEHPGPLTLEHRTPERTYALATFEVGDEPATPSLAEEFAVLRENPEWPDERERLEPYVEAAPDKTLAFVAELDLAHGHEHHHHHHAHGGHDGGGIEWEDEMVELNRSTTAADIRWKLVDRETGASNRGIDWKFTVGDRVKLRLVNEPDSDHPMHHPFHVHGAGRFVVLARDGVPETNYVWKDTVLVRSGETVDVLLDVTNPGRWMAHCHIAEHHESGMMLGFDVAPARAGALSR